MDVNRRNLGCSWQFFCHCIFVSGHNWEDCCLFRHCRSSDVNQSIQSHVKILMDLVKSFYQGQCHWMDWLTSEERRCRKWQQSPQLWQDKSLRPKLYHAAGAVVFTVLPLWPALDQALDNPVGLVEHVQGESPSHAKTTKVEDQKLLDRWRSTGSTGLGSVEGTTRLGNRTGHFECWTCG